MTTRSVIAVEVVVVVVLFTGAASHRITSSGVQPLLHGNNKAGATDAEM